MNADLRTQIWERAGRRCEYCRLPADYTHVVFEVDHVLARKHGGLTVLENLALSCFYCNSAKGPNAGGIDPQSGRLVRLFHPRTDHWKRHFRWHGPMLIGRTVIGRVTICVLDMNRAEFLIVRRCLMREGVFPVE